MTDSVSYAPAEGSAQGRPQDLLGPEVQTPSETGGRLWTIGEVVAYLKPMFPEVTVSKVRFWEQQGLIRPRRTGGGHRLYCPADVERLRLILDLRLRRRLPLHVVRSVLRRMDEDVRTDPSLIELFSQTTGLQAWEARPLQAVREELGWSARDLEEAVRLGFAFPCPKTGRLEPEDVAILRLLDEVRRMTGVSLADLASYARTARRLARQESRLLRRARRQARKTSSTGPDDGSRRLREAIRALLQALYLRYVQKEFLDRWVGSP